MKPNQKILLTGLSIIIIIFAIVIGLLTPNTTLQTKRKVVNKSPKLTEKHCLNSLCTNKMSMTYRTGTGTVEFTLKNEGLETVAAGFLKITSQEDKQIGYIVYHQDFYPDTEQTLKVICDTDNIINIKDYELTPLTKEELEEATELFYQGIRN